MMRARRRKISIIVMIVALFLLINVGYAFMSTELTIEGHTKINSSIFDVHFDNANEFGTNSDNCSSSYDSDGNYSFSSNLTHPGDYCEFHVDIVNGGNTDAALDLLSGGNPINSLPYIYEDNENGYQISLSASNNTNEINSLVDYKLDNNSTVSLLIHVDRSDTNCVNNVCPGSEESVYSFHLDASQYSAIVD